MPTSSSSSMARSWLSLVTNFLELSTFEATSDVIEYSTPRDSRGFALARRWTSTASEICSPTVRLGLKLLSGSWKIMLKEVPRSDLRTLSGTCSRSTNSPSTASGCSSRRSSARSRLRYSIEPSVISPGDSTRSMIDSAVTLFPLPDSPTMPNTSPRSIVRSSPSTALTWPSRVKNRVESSSTRRISSLISGPPLAALDVRVEGVPEPVAQ